MIWPFENDSSAIIKKIAKNDIAKNKIKKIFSFITIALVTAVLMSFAMFESGYELTKDRATREQPHVVFSNLSIDQVDSLRSDENVESIKIRQTTRGYDVLTTIKDATKMTQNGFSTVVNDITSKYDIYHTTKNDLFMDSLSNGVLLSHKNIIFFGVTLFVVIVSTLVIYNIFYLSVANQVQQFGQFRTIGMTQKQVKRIIRTERKMLCKRGIPFGLFVGTVIGYLLQPKGWELKSAIVWGVIISLIITFVVKISLNIPIKVASSIAPIHSSKYMPSISNYPIPQNEKRKLSIGGMALIGVAANRKKVMVSIISLGLSGLLFTLAATYTTSINAKEIVEKEIYQYGQFVINTTGEYTQAISEINNLIDRIEKITGVKRIKQIVETDIAWSGNDITSNDQLSIIKATDIATIQPFVLNSDLDYQRLLAMKQIIAVEGVNGISKGDTVEFTFGNGIRSNYTVGALLDSNIYTDTALYGGWYLLPEELIPENSGNFTTSIKLVIAANNNESKSVERKLNLLLSSSDNMSISTIWSSISEKETTIKQVSLSVIGITLLFLFFSIITFASTIITNITTRKREYALLQSIGMTCKQVRTMQLYESLLLATASLTITFILGIVFGHMMIKIMVSMGAFYLIYTFPFIMFIIYCISIILIISTITFFAFNTMHKASLVDRLRVVD